MSDALPGIGRQGHWGTHAAAGQWQGETFPLPQFLAIERHFVRKGCDRTREIATLPQFLAIEPHFVRKGCARTREIATLLQFLAIQRHFVRNGCARTREIATLFQFLAIEVLQEGKRARGQERMWRCEDVKMWRIEDVKMRRWEDEKMWGCEDEKMWRCENVWQTPTIRRTLRSDALGKKRAVRERLTYLLFFWPKVTPVNVSWAAETWPFWLQALLENCSSSWIHFLTLPPGELGGRSGGLLFSRSRWSLVLAEILPELSHGVQLGGDVATEPPGRQFPSQWHSEHCGEKELFESGWHICVYIYIYIL